MNHLLRRFKAEFFKALAHTMRIVLLESLRAGEKSVNELQTALGIDQSSVSRQLVVLRTRNIVEDRKEGTTVYYRVRDPARDYHAIVISMRGVPLLDAMGSQALAQIVDEQRQRGGTVSFSGLQPAVREMFGRTGLLKTIGEENIFWSADQAIVAIHGAVRQADEAVAG